MCAGEILQSVYSQQSINIPVSHSQIFRGVVGCSRTVVRLAAVTVCGSLVSFPWPSVTLTQSAHRLSISPSPSVAAVAAAAVGAAVGAAVAGPRVR